jgi:hypothetical protein
MLHSFSLILPEKSGFSTAWKIREKVFHGVENPEPAAQSAMV